MLRMLLFFFAWLLGADAALAGDERVPSKPCTPATTRRATVETVQASFDDWEGRCVTLRGIRLGHRLFADRRAAIEERPFDGSRSRSIVLYPGDLARREGHARWVDVTGRLGSCATAHAVVDELQAQSEGEIIWVSGYCHTSTENYLRPERLRVVSGKPVTRLTEAEVPEAQRPLVEAPAGLPGRAEHFGAARRLVESVSRREEATFQRLEMPSLPVDMEEAAGKRLPRGVADDLEASRARFRKLTSAASVFAGIDAAAGEARVFTDRDALTEDSGDAADRYYITCWCRSSDCDGRWPVSSADADNRRERPYACVRTGGYLVPGRGKLLQADASEPERGLAEPWPHRKARSAAAHH